MATDGVKIIDDDLAHDIYGIFMEMYDAGASLEEIRSAVQVSDGEEDEDGFDYEIFITVYALALWQTGQLTADVLQEVDDVIARGVGVRIWTEECDNKEGFKRQKELEKLRNKLSRPNLKIRKRRTYEPLKKFIFEKNSVLTFQAPNRNYYAAVLMDIIQYQGRLDYYFIESTYTGSVKPTIKDILDAEVVVREMHSSFNFKFGFAVTALSPKKLRTFSSELEPIGIIEIRSEAKKVGSYGGALDFESFYQNWINQETYTKNLGLTTIPLKDLL